MYKKDNNNNSSNTICNNIFSISENVDLIEKLQLKKFKFENAEPPEINMNNNSMIINNDVNQDENLIFSGNDKGENLEDILNIGEEQKKTSFLLNISQWWVNLYNGLAIIPLYSIYSIQSLLRLFLSSSKSKSSGVLVKLTSMF